MIIWNNVDDLLPHVYERCILLYSDNTISGGTYKGNRTFEVDYPSVDKSVTVVAWIDEKTGL